MSLNQTPAAERIHIGIFGKRNAGKSSLINALTGQRLAVVSEVAGTTTDPVYKAMELLPLGPVVLIDTPGMDDEGELGAMRVAGSYRVLNKTDFAILVVKAAEGVTREAQVFLEQIQKKGIGWMLVLSQTDVFGEGKAADAAVRTCLEQTAAALADCLQMSAEAVKKQMMAVSVKENRQIEELKTVLAALVPEKKPAFPLIADLLQPKDLAVLVVPIDKAAPKGRLILPQQQTIRDILEAGAAAVVVKETEYADTLKQIGKKPRLVITDSQVFGRVAKETPAEIPLTSFSILFARYKGELQTMAEGAGALEKLRDGDRVLISEGCTHHRQCGDIGTEKLPALIRKYTGADPTFTFTSGGEFPENPAEYALVIHCGGCMLNEREMKYRMACAEAASVPMTNYGIAIAQMQGILKRSLEVFEKSAFLFERNRV